MTAPVIDVAGERRAQVAELCPGLLEYLASPTWNGKTNKLFRPDLERELAELVWPRTITRPPTSPGAHFDVNEVDRFLRFARKLRHIKGRSYAGKPLELDLWQVVCFVGPIFGWLDALDLRIFSEAMLEVPRKNGKSTLCAAIALYLLTADREPGAEVISLAKSKRQARAVFDVAAAMAEKSPTLGALLKVLRATGVIRYDRKDSEYWVLASDAGGEEKHGGNLHGAIVDELHVITDGELIGVIESGTGSRDQPLIVYITTAGIASQSPVWMEKRQRIEAAAAGSDEPELWGVIYGADPAVAGDGRWKLEEVWKSANPGYGKSLRPSAIAAEARKARRSAARLNRFLRLHLGIPQEALSAWVPLVTVDGNAGIVDEGDLVGEKCYGGLDLASSVDLAAAVLLFPDEANEYLDVVVRAWMPEEGIHEKGIRDRAEYEAWRDLGFLTTTKGPTIDFDVVEDDLLELVGRRGAHRCGAMAFDRWGSPQLKTHLEKGGVPMIELGQGYASLSAPMKEAERLFYERRFRTGGNPLLRYCMGNVVARGDPAGNMKPDKQRSAGRIDVAAALIDAVAAWMRDTGAGESAYEDHDLIVVGGAE